ncbi:MAG: ABC transporter substrate-binding protein [Desulfobacteraceae bacterium]|jgi:branched-chain amino acid transport system substrate-binding protein
MQTSTIKQSILFVLLVSCFVFTQIANPKPALSKPAGPEIKIGFACGMTGSCRDWCKNNLVAVQMAIEEINSTGGIDGVPIKIVVHDTASNPAEAANVVRKLATDDKVLAIQGPFYSSECEVAFPVANELKIAAISQASSKPGVGAANRPYGFRNCPDEATAAKPAARKFIQKYNVQSVVMVHDVKDAVSRALGTKVFPPLYKKLGINIVNEGKYITYQHGDFDMRAQVTKLKGYKFDGIVFGGLYMDCATFLKEARRQGVNQPLMSGATIVNEYLIKQAGNAAEGVIAPTTFWPEMPGVAQRFVREFYKRAGNVYPTIQDAHCYDNIYLLAEIIKNMGVTNRPEDLAQDREKIMKGLTATKAWPGIEGTVGFDENGDGVVQVYVIEPRDGRWVEAK